LTPKILTAAKSAFKKDKITIQHTKTIFKTNFAPNMNIAIFASGGGSNALKIIEHFDGHPFINVALVVSNKQDAGVLTIAQNHGVPTLIIQRTAFYNTEDLLTNLEEYSIDFIVLAGFLWLIPAYLTRRFDHKMVNIHPALLPKYGGKGMYGMHVHEAVHAAKETQSGITIHYVNEHYDEGNIIFSATTPLAPTDTPKDIARKVLALEHQYFPIVIEQILSKKA
jgi:phosphoribosylglycinamide formyltransferase 1